MAIETGKKDLLPLSAIQLRAIVLALGESVRPCWWNTEFMNETGLRFLERLFPRSFFQAAIHAAGQAACEIHDRAVGRVGVYHLFRLPEALEVEIHLNMPSADADFTSSFRSCLGNKDGLLKLLKIMSDDEDRPATGPGPQRIGTGGDLTKAKTLRRTASVYYQAFSKNKQSFPYFSTE
jgi:hypothetical protein